MFWNHFLIEERANKRISNEQMSPGFVPDASLPVSGQGYSYLMLCSENQGLLAPFAIREE